MEIAIIALGSRGDVQPYLALGVGLKRAGHHVRVVTHEDFESLTQAHGLTYYGVKGSVQAIANSPEMTALLEKGNFIAITAKTAKAVQKVVVEWSQDGLEACRGADLIVAGIGGMFVGLALGEKLGIPIMQAHLVPFTATRAFPSVLLPAGAERLGGWFKRLSHRLTQQAIWQGVRSADNLARKTALGLKPVSFWGPFQSALLKQYPTLYGFSPSVIPKPDDWGDEAEVTGYWFLEADESWQPPAALTRFLEDGSKPIYIGFGSMSQRKPDETTKLILKALADTGQRAILLSGWGGLKAGDLPDTVYMAESIPHAWLFERVAAVVHHGGAGTTAAGLRAGVPSIIIPFMADQPFWGRRAAALGVGTEPIRRQQLTAELLAGAIRQVTDDKGMQERARALGKAIQQEDGVGRAVAVIQAHSPFSKPGRA